MCVLGCLCVYVSVCVCVCACTCMSGLACASMSGSEQRVKPATEIRTIKNKNNNIGLLSSKIKTEIPRKLCIMGRIVTGDAH